MKKIILSIIVSVLAIVVGYHYYNKIHDQRTADKVYQQMLVIDSSLDQLKESATTLHQWKSVNAQVIHGFNNLNVANFDEQKSGFLELINQLKFDNQVESQLLAITRQTTAKNFKLQRKLIKSKLQALKYDYNQHVDGFNKQISDLTSQVQTLKTAIATITSDNLQDLELARLKFISHKMSHTVTELNGSFIDSILEDVVEKDHISDTDSDGNE